MDKRIRWRLIVSLLVLGFSLWAALPLNKKISLGLDLKGGMHLVLKVDTSQIPKQDREDAVERALEVVRNRIDEFGVKEPTISRQGMDEIVLQLPGVTDRKRALDIIGRTAQLEFKLVVNNPDLLSKALSGQELPPEYEILYDQDERPYLVEKKALLSGDAVKKAYVSFDQYNQPVVSLEFTPEGAKKFAQITGENVGRNLAIVLDGKIQSAPVIRERIPSGRAMISGSFTPTEAQDLALVLRVGALPAPMKVVEERTVGPLLGQDSIRQGIKSAIIGALLVFLFMLVYYRLPGFIADLALIFNIIIILGGLGLFKATLTLPGIAGIILTLGMAVDANVLINERIKEELRNGSPIRTAIRAGYDKAFLTIVDSNLTTLIAALMLFQFGTGPIKGFAVTLSIGILASMFTAIVFTRLIFEIILSLTDISSLPMSSFFFGSKIDFLSYRKIAYLVSLAIILGGAIVFFIRGNSMFGIDFAGGYLQEYRFPKEVTTNQLRKELNALGIKDAVIQRFRDDTRSVIIRTKEDVVERVEEKFKKDFSGDLLRVERVGPSIGKLLKKKAILAIVWSLFGILVYIAFRFHYFNFAVAAVVALVHDVLVTLSFLAFTGRQLDLLIVTALLTIAGYSVNDTIVIYDRVREKRRVMRRASLYEIINTGINETLGRTIITSLTTLLVIISLYLFGGEVLNSFAFALLVGVISGTYSTIFIASPLVLVGRRVKK